MTELWTDEATGLACATHVGPMGNLNGYVAVPESRPWHGVGYSEHLAIECAEDADPNGYCWEHSPEAMVSVHGGITYAGTASFLGVESGWWFGFDTAHADDFIPGLWEEGTPRDESYVRAECTRLAEQLAGVTIASR